MIDKLIEIACQEQPFSDAKIVGDMPVIFNFPDGWRVISDDIVMSVKDIEELLDQIDENWRNIIKRKSVNYSTSVKTWRLRIKAFKSDGGIGITIIVRRIPRKTPTITENGLPGAIRLLTSTKKGLFIVAGATGMGKTSTLAAMIEDINNRMSVHIITIEDPMEYVFQPVKATFTQRELYTDGFSNLHDGVREAMGSAPDVIVVGEILDAETAEAAFLAAESGHFVLASMHGSSIAGAIQKLLYFFPTHEREARSKSLENNLIGLIYQELLPSYEGNKFQLAYELLVNHNHVYSDCISDMAMLKTRMDSKPKEDLSISFGENLEQLVREKKIKKAIALQSVSRDKKVTDRLNAIVVNE